MPQGTDVAEKDVFYQDPDYLLREIFIQEKRKGNALNEGIRRAKNDLICVLDADCILKEHANGYDTDTVGEDMELVLRLQDGGYQRSGNQIVYEPTTVCYTRVPHSLKRLLHQRDRWQKYGSKPALWDVGIGDNDLSASG